MAWITKKNPAVEIGFLSNPHTDIFGVSWAITWKRGRWPKSRIFTILAACEASGKWRCRAWRRNFEPIYAQILQLESWVMEQSCSPIGGQAHYWIESGDWIPAMANNFLGDEDLDDERGREEEETRFYPCSRDWSWLGQYDMDEWLIGISSFGWLFRSVRCANEFISWGFFQPIWPFDRVCITTLGLCGVSCV